MPRLRTSATTGAPDPLADYRDRPIISRAGPSKTYVGRVIVELWEDQDNPDDAHSMTVSAEAHDGDNAALLKRVATALPNLLNRGAKPT